MFLGKVCKKQWSVISVLLLLFVFQIDHPKACADEKQIGKHVQVDVRKHGAKCDGKTDDTAAINAAIAALPKSGGTLFFPPQSICITSGDHRLPSETTVLATGAIIRKNAVPNNKGANKEHLFLALDGTKNITVIGGTYDLNRSAFRDREQKGFALSAFYLRRHTGAKFQNVTVKNSPENAFKFWNVNDITVTNCRFENIFNNIIEFNNPKADGASPGTPTPKSENYNIENCYFQDVDDLLSGAGNGCGIAIAGTVLQPHRKINISNNQFIGCNRAIWFETKGIGHEVQHATVKHNTIIGSITDRQTLHGIGLVGVQKSEISHNTIINPGSTRKTVSEPAGITVSGDNTVESSDLSIHHNVIRDLRTPPDNMTRFGILLTRGNRIFVANNLISGSYEADIKIKLPSKIKDLKLQGNQVSSRIK